MTRRAKRRAIPRFGLALAYSGTSCTPAIAQSASGCRAPNALENQTQIEYLRSIVVDTDIMAVAAREAYGLQATTASKVALLTKSSTCVTAANAVNVAAGTTGKERQVWVYSVGTNYAVEDPAVRGDPEAYEYPIYFLDHQWIPKGVLMK